MGKIHVKLNQYVMRRLEREISEHPERFGTEIKCPACGKAVRLSGNVSNG